MTMDTANDLAFLRAMRGDAAVAVSRLHTLFTLKAQISAATYITKIYNFLCR